ncbi:MAG: CAP domain-containing protein [Bacteroidales bacterium]|nr:CAP domain-containing protein [Bacteroidales bacterium]
MFLEPIDFKQIDINRINAVIFQLTNEIRVKHNLKPLAYNNMLEQAAEMHARDMVAGNFFDHLNRQDERKKTPNDRALLCHITNPYLAENLIEGYGLQYTSNEAIYLRGKGEFSKTPDGELIKPHTYLSFGEAQLTGWMNSKLHRSNILSKNALELGCGAAYFRAASFNDMPTFYVVQNFQWYQPVNNNPQQGAQEEK